MAGAVLRLDKKIERFVFGFAGSSPTWTTETDETMFGSLRSTNALDLKDRLGELFPARKSLMFMSTSQNLGGEPPGKVRVVTAGEVCLRNIWRRDAVEAKDDCEVPAQRFGVAIIRRVWF